MVLGVVAVVVLEGEVGGGTMLENGRVIECV